MVDQELFEKEGNGISSGCESNICFYTDNDYANGRTMG